MKIIVVGHKEHGKTEFTKAFCRSSGMTCSSSSRVALELFLYEKVRQEFGYESIEQCWQDKYRSQDVRARWYSEIQEYNRENPTRLLEAIFETNDVYEGLRSRRELLASRDKKLADLVIWVDASERMPLEDPSSMTVLKSDANFVVDNNGTKGRMIENATLLGRLVRQVSRLR